MEALLSAAPSFCFLLLQFSSVNTMKQILNTQTTGDLSGAPYVSLFTNCAVWLLFGMLKADGTVILPNLSGAPTN
jgi:uncharacterized protein with PQ loop repeat